MDPGTYQVTLHFAELYHETADARRFGVEIEGQTLFSDFDLFAEVGYAAAYTPSTVTATVTDGQLDISVFTLTDNGTMSGGAVSHWWLLFGGLVVGLRGRRRAAKNDNHVN